MAQKQNVPVSFAQGLDTKTDPYQVQLGKLLELENGQFTNTGKITKRSGYDVLGNLTETAQTITQGASLATFNDELCLFDGYQMYSYAPSANNWSTIGQCVSLLVSSQQIIRTNEASQSEPCSCVISGVECVVWQDTRGGVWYSILDTSTGAVLVNEQQLNSSGYAPKVVTFQGMFVILYMLGNILSYQIISPLNPIVVQPIVNIHSDGYYSATYGSYDATTVGSKLFVSYLSNTPAIKLYYLDPSFTKSSITSVATGTSAWNTNPGQCISLVGDANQNVWLSWADGNNVRATAYTYILNSLFAPELVEASVGPVAAITGTVVSNKMSLFYELNKSSTLHELVHVTTVANDGYGTVGSISNIRGVGLASKAFQYQSVPYVNVVFSSTLQSTYFTISANGNIIAKINNEQGGGVTANTLLPEVTIDSTGQVFGFANLLKGKIISQNHTLFTPLGVNVTTLSFSNSNQFLTSVLSNNIFIVGGLLQNYDGANLTEAGFHVYPEGATATPSSSGGLLSTGSYQYTIVYAYTDNFGQINYSATHVPVTVTTTSNTSSVSLTIPTLRLTNKNNVIIVVYRTLVNQSNFYRVTSATSPILNVTNADTVTFVDTLADTAISSNELVYTTGGALDNIAPPACSIICTYNNRVFISGMEDPNVIWYSKNKFDNTNENTIPVEFSNLLTIGVNAFGGKITALAAMDSNLIIFKENNIYSLAGNGPDDTGNNSDFPISGPSLVTTDAGCTNASSVILMPQGLMFQSSKGMYLLDRSLQPVYIGAGVEAFNNYRVTSASLSQTTNQVIFTTNNGPTLVYDYFHGQWSTWTNLLTGSQGGVMWNGAFTFVKSNGLVYTQDETSFEDGGLPISLKWTTSNISLAQLQGYQMVYAIYLLGNFISPHNLQVQIAYDFNPSYTENCTVVPQNVTSVWGGGVTWGSDGYWGGPYNIYEFRVNPARKKCTAIRISVKDIQTAGNYGEGYSISNMMMVVGVLPGANRLPQSNQTGSQ